MERDMPQTGMDWWVIAGVLGPIVAGLYLSWRRSRSPKAKTTNTIKGGNGNRQSGGTGETENVIEDGNDNEQKG